MSDCRAYRRWQWTYEVQEKEKRGEEEVNEWEGLEFGTGREEEGARGVGHGVGGDAIATRLSYDGGAGRDGGRICKWVEVARRTWCSCRLRQ